MTSIKHKLKLYRDALVNPNLWDSHKLYRNKLIKLLKTLNIFTIAILSINIHVDLMLKKSGR